MRCSFCNFQINKPTRASFIACFCKQTNYCDKDCQRKDWCEGGHRDNCEYYSKIKRDKLKAERIKGKDNGVQQVGAKVRGHRVDVKKVGNDLKSGKLGSDGLKGDRRVGVGESSLAGTKKKPKNNISKDNNNDEVSQISAQGGSKGGGGGGASKQGRDGGASKQGRDTGASKQGGDSGASKQGLDGGASKQGRNSKGKFGACSDSAETPVSFAITLTAR